MADDATVATERNQNENQSPERELRARFLEIDRMDRDDGVERPTRAGVSIDALHRHTSQTINGELSSKPDRWRRSARNRRNKS